MESSGIRSRNIEKNKNVSNKLDMKLDIVAIDAYNCLDGRCRVINVKPYGDWKEKLYQTFKDGFIIKDIDYDSYSVIGRLVNGNIIPLTDYEQKICLSENFLIENTSKYQ